VIIDRPVDEVVEYISDLDRYPNWRADLIGISAIPPGPAKLGTVVHQVIRVMKRQIAADVLVDDVTATSFTFSRDGAASQAHGSYTKVAQELATDLRSAFISLESTMRSGPLWHLPAD
jgi:hypothetical protein